LVGIFVPGVARFFIFKGMDRLGASITSCLTNATPLFATLFAVSFLREQPSATNLLGTLSIVGGIVSLSWRGSTRTWRTRDLLFPLTAAFLFAARDNMVRFGVAHIHAPILAAAIAATTSFVTMLLLYVLFEKKTPLTAAFLFAARDNMVRFGVAHIHAPILAAAIAATTSFVTMLLLYVLFEKKTPLTAAAPRGFTIFAAAGFMNFLSYAFAYTALSMESVSIVSPLINASSLFVLPLSAVFLKDVDRLTPRKIGAIVLVIFGVLLISWEKL
jgi:drug/metabolite transporter (DMT)-like permease